MALDAPGAVNTGASNNKTCAAGKVKSTSIESILATGVVARTTHGQSGPCGGD
jgi:hypothetical protein